MFKKSVFEDDHVFTFTGIVLHHGNHFTLLEDLLHLLLQE